MGGVKKRQIFRFALSHVCAFFVADFGVHNLSTIVSEISEHAKSFLLAVSIFALLEHL